MTDVEQSTGEDSNRSDDKSSSEKDDNSYGISAGCVPDNCLFSSSALNQSCGANQARLHKQPYKEKYGAWTPLYDDKNQYLDIDLGELVEVGAIATQGRPAYIEDGGWFVESYSLAYGNDGDNYQNLKEYGISKVFEGNKDPETVVKNQLRSPMKCRWVRIKPVTWHNHAALRVELYKFTGNPQNSRKKQNNQKQTQKSAADRGTRQNTRGVRTAIQVKENLQTSSHENAPIRVSDAEEIKLIESTKEEGVRANGEASDVKIEERIESKYDEAIKGPEVTVTTSHQDSFEVIDTSMEQEIVAEQKVLQEIKKPEKAENQSRQNGEHSPRKPEIIPAVSVRDQAQVFRNRPAVEKVDPSYRLKMKGASAVATRSDGSKFIGKIKLVKKAEQPPEEDAEEEALQRHGPDCVVPDVVKDRLSNYQEVVLRNKGSRVNEDLSKRKSLALEEDLKYRNEMESSVFDRLRQFKETEHKSKENLELSKQEEEKRQSLKRDAEKKRSLALQKEKERNLALLQKQKEEEEEKRRKREEEEAEKFVEIEAEKNGPEVPAVVNDRLKIFKESEKHEKEKQEALKAEAEKRRLAKEDAERKRQIAEQKERERLQELMNKKQKELEEQKKVMRVDDNSESNDSSDVVDGSDQPVVPAIVHDRIKLFKEGEKANRERDEALRIEAQKKRAAAEEAERIRIVAEEKSNASRKEIPVTRIDDVDDVEEEVVVVEEEVNVESEMTFDFMEEEIVDKELAVEEQPVSAELEKDENQNEKEALDLQTKLQGIDTHHEGYDPDHERRMLEEAEEAFRTYAAHQKGGSKAKRSSKTESLIRSFTVDSTSSSEPMDKRGSSKMASARKPLEKAKSFDEQIITGELKTGSVNEVVSSSKAIDESKDACVKGMVKDRANVFSKHIPPVSGNKTEGSHADVKKWIASQPPQAAGVGESERVLLTSQLEELENRSKMLSKEIENLKAEEREEEALELEEDLHANLLEISKIKRRLIKIQKEHGGPKHVTRESSVTSETRSVPDDAGSDRASSSGSRSTQKGSSGKLSRECKAPMDKPLPPVDVNSYNDDGDIVVEGNVLSQIKNYEEESARQRKQRAEVRKSLSLSRSSLESFENAPPMGFGGPEFAKDKAKLSKECKLEIGREIPAVDQEGFNDDGDCVTEGNVLQQIKMFSKN